MATADDEMLPVVHRLPGSSVRKGKGPAAQKSAGFDQRNRIAGIPQGQGGGDAGHAAAEDDHARGRHHGRRGRAAMLPSHAWAITRTLTAVDTCTRRCSTS